MRGDLRNRLSAALLVIVAAIALAACGGESKDDVISDGDAISGLRIDVLGLLDGIERRLAEVAAGGPDGPLPVSWSSR